MDQRAFVFIAGAQVMFASACACSGDEGAPRGECARDCPGDQVCSGSFCAAECPTGMSACGGVCVDRLADATHCGGCETACGAGEGCVAGSCVASIALGAMPECLPDPIIVRVAGGDVCLGHAAQTAFTWALCACEDVRTSDEVTTDAYDSTRAPYLAGGTGGGIGAGGAFDASNKLTLGGTLWSSDPLGAATRGDTAIAHELHVGGPFGAAVASVGGDAFIAGDVSADGSLAIGGVLYQGPGASIGGEVTFADHVVAPLSVPPPCRCAAEERLPIAALVAAHAAVNDNALIGLPGDVLLRPDGARHLALGCGRYYLDAIDTTHKTTILATGRAALFVGGDLRASDEFQIAVLPGVELDLFIGGTLDVSNKLRIGSPDRPALVRVYVAGSDELVLTDDAALGGYLYAAESPVRVENQLEVFGGMFVRSLEAKNKLTLHYDRAILGVGHGCAFPGACLTCGDCGNQACADGVCGACRTSGDCCAPLACIAGACASFGISISIE